MNILIIILFLVIAFVIFGSNQVKEGYTSRGAKVKEYAYSPSYEPIYMYNNWAFYNPYRIKYGLYTDPYYFNHPYYYGYYTPSGYFYY